MRKFRKKPVVIEALRFDNPADVPRILDWITNDADRWFDGTLILIKTLEGVMAVFPGDWVIKGVAGEFYPCKPEIFAATYEPVEETDEASHGLRQH